MSNESLLPLTANSLTRAKTNYGRLPVCRFIVNSERLYSYVYGFDRTWVIRPADVPLLGARILATAFRS